EGVAFASATRWGKVVKIIQALDNAGDIVGWAAKVGRRLPVPRKILDRIREATRRGAPDAAIPPTGHATDATVGSDARSRSDTPETVTPEGDGCFVAGSTVVTTSGLRAIENLRIGMRVLASDPETRTQAVHAITRTFVHEVPALLDLAIGGTTITCSPAHPFWVVGRGWTSAGSLYSGDKLVSQGGDELPLDAITRRSGAFTVYNITVESLSTYHVSESRVLVHNKPAHLDEEAAFRSRKDGIYETVQELGERLEKIRSHATTDAQKAALKRFENDIRTLEQQANGATYPSRLTDDDSNFDSFDRIETLETRALKRMEALEKELTPKRKIPADRPARDHETILADGTGSFTRTGKTFQGRQIYRDEGGRLYYVDNLHEGAASEIEVFSSTGKHVGTMSVDGVFNPDGKVDGRYLNKDLL
ncbi:MAG TPA: polymorphic toxin-type HINT domain-containing protein, partial [Kofleriaceae bacterium]|nr:polymorphic toxin-type HINT domain-containing protein [Kofleriaceae bacterium]